MELEWGGEGWDGIRKKISYGEISRRVQSPKEEDKNLVSHSGSQKNPFKNRHNEKINHNMQFFCFDIVWFKVLKIIHYIILANMI